VPRGLLRQADDLFSASIISTRRNGAPTQSRGEHAHGFHSLLQLAFRCRPRPRTAQGGDRLHHRHLLRLPAHRLRLIVGNLDHALSYTLRRHRRLAQLGDEPRRSHELDDPLAEISGADPERKILRSVQAREREQAMGQLDVLVANAGMARDNLLVQLRDEDWDQVIAVDLTAAFKLMRAAAFGMESTYALAQKLGRQKHASFAI